MSWIFDHYFRYLRPQGLADVAQRPILSSLLSSLLSSVIYPSIYGPLTAVRQR